MSSLPCMKKLLTCQKRKLNSLGFKKKTIGKSVNYIWSDKKKLSDQLTELKCLMNSGWHNYFSQDQQHKDKIGENIICDKN